MKRITEAKIGVTGAITFEWTKVKLKDSLPQLLGKRICGAVIKEGDCMPRMQVFLVFDDDTYYEIYADSMIYGAGGIDNGGIENVRQYMPEKSIVYECHAELPYKNLGLFEGEDNAV